MNQKFIPFIFILTLLLSGCAAAEASEADLQPLTDWPTPAAVVAAPTATPFPKISLADIRSQTPESRLQSPDSRVQTPDVNFVAEDAASDQGQMTNNQLPMTADADATRSTQPITALTSIAAARLAAAKTEIRPGPGTGFAPIDELTEPLEPLAVLGLDASRQWALVQPQHSRQGWAALADLQIDSALAAAPTVYTAWVNANEVSLHSGPGIFHPAAGLLPINSLVRVIGVNEGRSWALVQPVGGSDSGWAELLHLTLSNPLLGLPIAPAPQQAAAPASNPAADEASARQGQLVFQTSSGGKIMLINADGSGLRQLTHGLDPALSPDGRQVAFTRWAQGEAGPGSLWMINTDGTDERQLLEFVKQPKGAEWSPDGAQIVINFQHEGRLTDENVAIDLSKHRDATEKVPWNAEGVKVDYEPVVRGGKVVGQIPYLKYTFPPDPHWSLRVVNVADGSFEDMDGGTYAFRPAWDPAQPWRIVSDGGRGLVQVDVNRNASQPITDNLGDGSPVFSPDGRYLAVSVGKPGGGDGYNIYRLNADGTGRVQLTKTPLYAPLLPGGDNKQWNNVSPAWSPDGTQIAFLTDRSGRWEVWVMAADGSNPRPMFAPAVSEQLDIQYNFVDEKVLSWR